MVSMETNKRARGLVVLLISSVLLLLSFVFSISVGAANIDFTTVWKTIFQFGSPSDEVRSIIMEVRLPRQIAAILVGAALAVGGAIMQGITRNPLAEPGLLGLNAGAGFALALIFTFIPAVGYLGKMGAAFVGAAFGAILVYRLGSVRVNASPVRLILTGAIVHFFLLALAEGTAILFRISQDISFWYIGRITGVNWVQIEYIAPVVLLGIFIALIYSRHLTILSLNEEVAKGLGQDTTVTKIILMGVVLMLAGVSVAVAGMITFVGLVIPHMVRYLVGVDYRWVIPCSAFLGSLFMIIADTIGRIISAPYETPVGAIISLIGVPYFIFLARRGSKTT
ncbi:iron complex transport system permease protein [Seinonella peptonophila]|uniref:Iron complex transport system permease protein n=1 Tax=Seinonella peptonophila TaxID=112248 RepID=A0A1M4X6W1_9BACL|nr:iron ABC transporter permease [Seinonella peptonophila]SHE89240.1 iron complex transport system permease protein [Seinonella peptonophila]